MPRIPGGGGDDGGGGGGSTSPSPQAQAIAARRLRGDVGVAEEHAQVITPAGEHLTPAPVQVKGGSVAVAYDSAERRAVVTLPDLIQAGTAAARPASPTHPMLYIATDTGAHSSWDGSTWRTV
jgi:hypothetical protein